MALLIAVLSASPVPADEPSSLPTFLPEARLLSPPAPSPWWSLDGGSTTPACRPFRILRLDERPAECEAPILAAGAPPAPDDLPAADPEVRTERPSQFWTYAIPAGVVAGSAANAFLETPHQSFHFGNEGWFARDSYAGGADKASHFVDYFIISKELSYLYNTLGYSRKQSIGLGLGVALLGGLMNEFGDGFNRYGFSYEDLAMDASGALAAALVSTLGAHDLVGFRRGFLLPPYSNPPGCCPGDTVGQAYSSQIFTADLKLAGLARRLNLNVGPLRYLLVSVTYGTKGYATGMSSLFERQVGFEVGLNVEEILDSIGVRRTTWWGYALHVVLDNVRVPFTSVGFQVDLNSGQWFGPGNGNSYSSR
jgi:hypothetical protein